MLALAQQSNIIDEVIHGEALAVLRTLPDNSVDAIVCDPPAGISFMGKDWDSYGPPQTKIKIDADKYGGKASMWKQSGGNAQPTRKERDAFISFLSEVMAEALRVLKPGGHAFVWALPRTSHWTGIALEDAGFEMRDVVTHLFGSGFPKSMDVSKVIDKMHGAEREYLGPKVYADGTKGHDANYNSHEGWRRPWKDDPEAVKMAKGKTAPATPEASQWNGWGTSLKPASEHWWLCRKPLSEPTIAANVLKWGTGALAIDKCRVGNNEPDLQRIRQTSDGNSIFGMTQPNHGNLQGRWPANLLLSHSVWCVPNGVKKVKGTGGGWNGLGNTHRNAYSNQGWSPDGINRQNTEGMEQVDDWLCDESCPIRLLDEQSGMRKSGSKERMTTIGYGQDSNHTFDRVVNHEASEGGASRYFQRFAYIPKASRAERNRGCEGLPEKQGFDKNTSKMVRCSNPDTGEVHYNEYQPSANRNSHPTVKSLSLMRYLVRLITPPGGIVLDCFAGSGSTLVAAIHEGMHFIGIEMNDSEQEPYISIARARIEQAFREVQS